MSSNTERIETIRTSTYGREVRAPIAESLEATFEDTDDVIDMYEEVAEWLVSSPGVKKSPGLDEYLLCLELTQ